MKRKTITTYRMFTRAEKARYGYPDDWVAMHIGKKAPPGTPVGKTGGAKARKRKLSRSRKVARRRTAKRTPRKRRRG
jgi:hypothetical protein